MKREKNVRKMENLSHPLLDQSPPTHGTASVRRRTRAGTSWCRWRLPGWVIRRESTHRSPVNFWRCVRGHGPGWRTSALSTGVQHAGAGSEKARVTPVRGFGLIAENPDNTLVDDRRLDDAKSTRKPSLWKTHLTNGHLRSNCFEIQYMVITSW